MKKKWLMGLCAVLMAVSLTACGGNGKSDSSNSDTAESSKAEIEDGVYTADFQTDSGMFHVNEANDGKGKLTVENGEMTIHVSLASKNIEHLFAGTAEEAKKDGAKLLEPTTDTVTYSDGMTEEVYGFDIPVPALNQEFDVALVGTKGNWYDHKVTVSNPVKEGSLSLEDGIYPLDDFSWEGGTGRVNITCAETEIKDGQAYVTISFSSSYYSKVRIGETEYEGTATEDTAQFTVPVTLNEDNTIFATTTRMSEEHEIEYQIHPYLEAAGSDGEAAGSKDTDESVAETEGSDTSTAQSTREISRTAPQLEGQDPDSQMKLDYAEGFDVFHYSAGYSLINIYDSARYLVLPEGVKAPADLDSQIVVLQQPLDHIYLAATSSMSLFRALNCLDQIRFTGTKADGWYVQEAADAMKKKEMVFAGKYSQPDYELLVNEGCKLAIESTMILHTPKVQEMLERLEIPVFIDRSSYEKHPLGRTEWIKLYGVLMGKETQADTFFAEQENMVSALKDFKNTEKTVAFFYVDTNGSVVVRSSDDYIPRMIEIAGGRYAFENLEKAEDSNSASISMTMEEFYALAMDADYLIYNGTIDNPLDSKKDLLAKSGLFADFKAVKDGNVWTVGKNLYQSTDTVAQMIVDLHQMITDDTKAEMTFLSKVK